MLAPEKQTEVHRQPRANSLPNTPSTGRAERSPARQCQVSRWNWTAFLRHDQAAQMNPFHRWHCQSGTWQLGCAHGLRHPFREDRRTQLSARLLPRPCADAGPDPHGLGIEGARQAAADLVQLWIMGKAANGEPVTASSELSCAEAARAGQFLTGDDRLRRRYSGPMTVQNPVTFITSLT